MPNFASVMDASGAAGFNNTDPTSTNNAILLPLGTPVYAKDSRAFRWIKNGAVDTVAGSLYQSAAQITAHQNSSVTATAIGATVVNVTGSGATTGAANLYAEGYLIVHTTPGLGYTYHIDSHPAIGAGTAFNVTLSLDDPIQVALTTSSKVDLQANPWQNVVVTPTTLTASPAGVATYIVTAAFNGWIQTWGCAGVLINGTPAVGNAVVSSATTGGALDIISSTFSQVGTIMVTGVSTKVQPVFLCIG